MTLCTKRIVPQKGVGKGDRQLKKTTKTEKKVTKKWQQKKNVTKSDGKKEKVSGLPPLAYPFGGSLKKWWQAALSTCSNLFMVLC